MDIPKVSLVIITKNEEEKIAACIESAPWVDEVVLLDSDSTDRTLEIAKAKGARIFSEPFRGFRDQKQRATDLASHDWILSLDADERLSPQLSQELQSLLKSSSINIYDGFEMPRLSFHLGRWIRHGGWYPDRQLRLFHRKKCHWGGGHIHERVIGDKVFTLQNPLHHLVFRNLAHQVDTNNRYSSLGAEDLVASQKPFSLAKLLAKPLSKFFETYFLKKGFLDGLPGIIIAVGAAYSVFLKFAKQWERTHLPKSPGPTLPP